MPAATLPSPPPASASAPGPSEAAVREAGRGLLHDGPRFAPRRFLEDRATVLTARDPRLRAALLRFVDVAPACRDRSELSGHLEALLADADQRLAGPIARVGSLPGGAGAVGFGAGRAVRAMARRFILAEDPRRAAPAVGRLWTSGVATTVDLLGEATLTAAEADRYAARCAESLEAIAAAAGAWPSRPLLERDGQGPLPRAHLSVKLTALTPLMRGEDPERGAADAARRLRPLLRRARDLGAHLHVDVESFDTREATLIALLGLLAEPEFADGPSAGVVLQCYLVEADDHLRELRRWSARTPRAHPLAIRLVKGAYWDHESADSEQHGWRPPTHATKAETDRAYERLTRELLAASGPGGPLRAQIASHNARSVAHAIACNRALGRDDAALEIQVLRGLGDDLQDRLRAGGHRVRQYAPVGDLVSGMAYLVRRLLENSANESFLLAAAGGGEDDELLTAP